MAKPYDPFNIGARDPNRDPANGPAVPNMGGIPSTPLSPAANLNPFAIPPVATPDAGGRPTEGAAGTSPLSPTGAPTAPAPNAPPPTEGPGAVGPNPSPEGQHDRNANQSGVTINIGEQGKKPEQSAGGTSSPTTSGGMAPTTPQGPVAGLPAPIPLNRMPTAPEMNFAPPGSVFETPNGSMTRGADGNWQFQPNEAGIAKYKEAKVKAIQKFGSHPFSSDPGAPLPPVEPGQPAYNPFTNSWTGE